MRTLVRTSLIATALLLAISIGGADQQNCLYPLHPGVCGVVPPSDYARLQGLLVSDRDGLLAFTQATDTIKEFISPDGSTFVQVHDPNAGVFVCTPDVLSAAVVDFPNNLELCIRNFFNPPFAPGTLALTGTGRAQWSGHLNHNQNQGECPVAASFSGVVASPDGVSFRVVASASVVPTPEETCAVAQVNINLTPVFTKP